MYDNACNASRFCLAREPDYFADVIWIIDALHNPGHVECSQFSVDLYEELLSFHNIYNSQKAEEFNSEFERVKSHLYMFGHFGFFLHLRYMCHYRMVKAFKRRNYNI